MKKIINLIGSLFFFSITSAFCQWNPGQPLTVPWFNVSGACTVGAALIDNVGSVYSVYNGSDTAGVGPFYCLKNPTATQSNLIQNGASGTLDHWIWNGSSYILALSLNSTGVASGPCFYTATSPLTMGSGSPDTADSMVTLGNPVGSNGTAVVFYDINGAAWVARTPGFNWTLAKQCSTDGKWYTSYQVRGNYSTNAGPVGHDWYIGTNLEATVNSAGISTVGKYTSSSTPVTNIIPTSPVAVTIISQGGTVKTINGVSQ